MLVVELPRPNSHAKVRASFFEPIHLPSRDLEDVAEDPDEQAPINRDLAGKDRDVWRRVAAMPETDEDGSETSPPLSLLCFLCASGIPGGGNLVPPSPVLFQASSPFSSFFYGQGHQSHELADESTKTDVVWSAWPWFVGAIDVDGGLNPGFMHEDCSFAAAKERTQRRFHTKVCVGSSYTKGRMQFYSTGC